MKVALIGATGLVGEVMRKVLEEKRFPCDDFYPVASEKSIGKLVQFNGNPLKVCSIEDALAAEPDIAIFSAGSKISLQYAEKFARKGCFVIDNSSAWRAKTNVPLIVPEINADTITPQSKIISNPNCSTIQMAVVIAPLHQKFNIKRIVVSTYQSVTGTGVDAVRQLDNERAGIIGNMAYPHPIDLNCFPHGGDFNTNGYTSEEMKLINETRKILNDPVMKITSTVVRIPVKGGHSEAVNIEFENSFDINEIKSLLEQQAGLVVEDDPASNIYPMPKYCEGKDEIFVGRIRRDESVKNGLNMWIVADNLRKGAATNAIQIAQYLVKKGFINNPPSTPHPL